ncbi:hypothetical protein BDF14DRAFT_1881883 [Spinellus fusiger]|nr:hypothetical protein BDF14DRAFT_1881883 [Spinellus fusiger]
MPSYCVLALTLMGMMTMGTYAHVTLTPPTAIPGQLVNATLNVPHGCNGSPTNDIKVTVPQEVSILTPAPVENWTLDVHYTKLSPEIKMNGVTINQTVSSFSWTGGYIAPTELKTFSVWFIVPSYNLTANSNVTLFFPTVQTCLNGSTSWTDLPNTPGFNTSVSHPPPGMVISNPAPTASGGDASHSASPTPSHTNSGSSLAVNILSGLTVMTMSGFLLF